MKKTRIWEKTGYRRPSIKSCRNSYRNQDKKKKKDMKKLGFEKQDMKKQDVKKTLDKESQHHIQ